jgi:hypothetical protein
MGEVLWGDKGGKDRVMQTPAAHDKLAEARFFLNRLKEENKKPFRNEPEAFGCFLGAFLSAARSVTLVLKAEAKKTYDEVFPRWLEGLSNEDRELLEYMKGQRNLEIHNVGAEITVREKLIPAETIPGFHVFAPPLAALGEEEIKKHVEMTEKLGLPPWTMAWIHVPEYHFRGPKECTDVIERCERYVGILDRLLQQFSVPSTEPKK